MTWSIVLATISILILVKSMFLLAYPNSMKRFALWFMKTERRTKLGALASAAVGIVLGVLAVALKTAY